MTVAAKPGDFWNWRRANFRSVMAETMDGRETKREAGAMVSGRAVAALVRRLHKAHFPKSRGEMSTRVRLPNGSGSPTCRRWFFGAECFAVNFPLRQGGSDHAPAFRSAVSARQGIKSEAFLAASNSAFG